MRSLPIARHRLPYLAAWLVNVGLVVGVNIVSISQGYESAINLQDFAADDREDIRNALAALRVTPTQLA